MRHLLAVVASLTLLLLPVGAASARTRLGFSPSNVSFAGEIELESGLGTPVRCNLTLAMTLHSSVGKVADSLAGMTNLTFGSCSNGDMGLLVGGRRVTGSYGPYHLTYRSFSGTLPNITSVSFGINDVTFWVEITGLSTCLSNGAVDMNGETTGGNPATGMRIDAARVPLTGGVLCVFVSSSLTGRGRLSTALTLTLI